FGAGGEHQSVPVPGVAADAAGVGEVAIGEAAEADDPDGEAEPAVVARGLLRRAGALGEVHGPQRARDHLDRRVAEEAHATEVAGGERGVDEGAVALALGAAARWEREVQELLD